MRQTAGRRRDNSRGARGWGNYLDCRLGFCSFNTTLRCPNCGNSGSRHFRESGRGLQTAYAQTGSSHTGSGNYC